MPRKTSIRKRRFVEPARTPELPLEQLLHDGILLAIAGVRMTVRNLIIVRALGDGADYDEGWYVAAVQHEFHALAAEKRAEAARVSEQQPIAATRSGRATHHSDFRWEDAPVLARRAAALTGLAERLDEIGDHPDAALELVQTARESALDDIANSIRPERVPVLADDYAEHRQERMALVLQDLAMLELQDPTL